MKIALVDFGSIWGPVWNSSGDDEVDFPRRRVVGWIRELVSDFDRAAICVDSPKSWRRDLYSGYKANREAKSVLQIEELRKAHESLRDDGFPILGAEGYEADDVLAAAAMALVEHHVTIISADKDLWQCLHSGTPDDHDCPVDVLRPHTKPPTLVTVASLLEDKGLTPKQIPHWLALMGDTSDNVPGVKGVGDKTACKLLGQFGSVKGVVAAAINKEGMTAKGIDTVLAADCDPDCNLDLALELVTLDTDAPVDVSAVLEERKTKPMEDEMDDETPEAEPTQPSEREPETVDAEPVSAPKTAALVRYQPPAADWDNRLEPRDMTEAKAYAKIAFDSRLFSGYGNAQAIFMTITTGADLGVNAPSSLRGISIIKGKAALGAALMKGLCHSHPKCRYFTRIDSTEDAATYETHRDGDPGPVRNTYTWDDAKDDGLENNQGYKTPGKRKRMLRWRCIADLARDVYPDALHNTYLPDELEN